VRDALGTVSAARVAFAAWGMGLIAVGDALWCLAGYARKPKHIGHPERWGSVVAVAGQAGASLPPELEPA